MIPIGIQILLNLFSISCCCFHAIDKVNKIIFTLTVTDQAGKVY